MVKIKTTHVGSLPRSNELSSLLASKDNQEKIDISSFDAVVKKNVSEVVKKQINTGIDSVSDGEMSKISYATYIKDRVDGFSGESERKAPKDLDDFPSYKEISEKDFLERANKHVEVLNNSLSNIDPSKVRMHICWGNYEGPHIHDIGLDKIIGLAFKANVSKYLIESANPRHAHEWEVFENIKVPKDKMISPGVIEYTSNFI